MKLLDPSIAYAYCLHQPQNRLCLQEDLWLQKEQGYFDQFFRCHSLQCEGMVLDVEILDPYQAPRIKGIKDSYLDVKATIQDKQTGSKTVIIEMQVLNVLGFEKRVLYNAAKSFSIQLGVGENYTC